MVAVLGCRQTCDGLHRSLHCTAAISGSADGQEEVELAHAGRDRVPNLDDSHLLVRWLGVSAFAHCGDHLREAYITQERRDTVQLQGALRPRVEL